MKRAMSMLLIAAAVGAAFADTPDKLVEYVESSGVQYVDTGIIGRSGTKAEMRFNANSDNGSGVYLLSAYGNSTYMNFCYFGNSINVGFGGNSYNTYWTYSRGVTYTLRAEYSLDQKVIAWRDDKSEVTKDGAGGISSGLTLYAFARNNSGHADGFCSAKLYSMKIWQTGENGEYQLVRSFLPCKKNGVAGLYDEVSGEIFYGMNGELIAPPELPDADPDVFIDYVESDGTQYVDTGVVGKDGTKSQLTMEWTKTPPLDVLCDWCFLGSCHDGKMFYLFRWLKANGYNPGIYSGYNGRWGIQGWMPPTDRPFEVVTEVTANGTFTMSHSGTTKTWDYTGNAPADTGCSLYLFARNNDGTADNFTPGRCYGLKIEQLDANGDYKLVRDFSPCLKNGVAGLYDSVSRKIFFSKAGVLHAGPQTGIPAKFVEYVESDGSLHVDTGVVGRPGVKAAAAYMWTEVGGDVCLLGARASAATETRFMPFYSFQSRMDLEYGAWANNFGGSYEAGTLYNAAASIFAGSQKLTVNGVEVVSLEKADLIDTGLSMFIFANNIGGSAKYNCRARLYGMKIWTCSADGSNAILVRDFRPCVGAGSLPALYDKISGAIYYAQGGRLTAGGSERAVAATARWIGGTVADEAGLAVAENWECRDAGGNVVANATPGAATTVLVPGGSALLSLPAGTAVQDWAGSLLESDSTLDAAGDWTPLGVMTIADGAMVDLNGHDLVAGGFSAAGSGASVANSGAAATLTFAVADGGTAKAGGISFADKVNLAKSGDGILYDVNYPFAYGTTFTLAEGRCAASGVFLVRNSSGHAMAVQSGGTMNVGTYLTLAYGNGTYGTYTMTGGELMVGTRIELGQSSGGKGVFDLSGTGVATATIRMAINAGGEGELNVHDGGRLRTASIYKGDGTPVVKFDGGVLEPLGDVEGLLEGLPLTIGPGGLVVDTAGRNASLGNFTVTSGGELVKTGEGTLAMTALPALEKISLANGALTVAAEAASLDALDLATGTRCDLGGGALACGVLSGSGTVANGAVAVAGAISVKVGEPLTFSAAPLTLAGARVVIADLENMPASGREPVVVAVSDRPMTGHVRSAVPEWAARMSQRADGSYALELVRSSFSIRIR